MFYYSLVSVKVPQDMDQFQTQLRRYPAKYSSSL